MSQDNIFREVDEELRSERMRKLWHRFGPYVIGAAIAVVLVVAVNEGWTWWRNSNAARVSDQFYTAIETADGDATAGQAALNEVIASGDGGYATLARFKQAGLLAKEGKAAEAIAAYDALATAESNPRIRELALLLAANLLVDSGDVAAVQSRIGGLLAPENGMRNAAREALGLAQYKAGDLDAARKTFEEITADPRASRGVVNRAQLYLAQLVSEGVVAPEAPADASAAPAADAPVEAPAAEAPAADAPAPAAPAAEVPPVEGVAPAN